MNINFITKKDDGCDYHRLIVPFQYMKGDGIINMIPHSTDMGDEIYQCDILYFNRGINPCAKTLSEKREEFGCKIVIDLDDYWQLYKEHPLYNNWMKSCLGSKIVDNLQIADLVTVTNQQLADEVYKLNKNVEILPNSLPAHAVNRKESDKMRFIYSGSTTHTFDMQLLQKPMIDVGADSNISNNSHFYLAGYSPGPWWDSMARIFQASGSYSLLARKPLDEYMNMYNKGDVSLIPLQKNKFNQLKSILKIQEAATMQMPVIVSKVLPYTELQGAPGILWVRNQGDWLQHIKYCVNNRNWVADQGIALHEYMNEHYNFDVINEKRYNVLKNLVGQHEHTII